MDNKKIILLTHEYPPKRGGAGVYCEELVFAARKIKISIEAWVPHYAEKELRIHNLKGSQGWICSYCLFRKILKSSPSFTSSTLLHFAEPGSLRAMTRFGWLFKKIPSFIVTIHGTELIRFCKNPLEKILFRKMLKRAKKIHVLSRYNQIELQEICHETKDRILLCPGAPARNLAGNDAKTENSDNQVTKLLCVARIHPRKGQDQVLKAIENLPSNLKKNLECLFVGPVVKKSFYEKLRTRAMKIGCTVTFLGDLEERELKSVYQSSDIFILPSMPRANSVEGFGFVYLEASSHGLPILAHRIGGVEDAIKDGETGILTNPEKPEELEKALKTLLVDETLRAQLGDAGKEWANAHSWKSVAKALYQE